MACTLRPVLKASLLSTSLFMVVGAVLGSVASACSRGSDADLKVGIEAYKTGDYATALERLQPAAKRDNAGAQSLLGSMYAQGLGVARSHEEAAVWYSRAADQGDP